MNLKSKNKNQPDRQGRRPSGRASHRRWHRTSDGTPVSGLSGGRRCFLRRAKACPFSLERDGNRLRRNFVNEGGSVGSVVSKRVASSEWYLELTTDLGSVGWWIYFKAFDVRPLAYSLLNLVTNFFLWLSTKKIVKN